MILKSPIVFATLLAPLLLLNACSQPPNSGLPIMKYPDTHKDNTVDTYFGIKVPDPYRWLEDDRSEATADWVNRQNAVTFDYLAKISYREEIKSRLEKMWNYEKESAPFREGRYEYVYRNNGLQNQFVIYRSVNGDQQEVFLDPNTFSEDGTTSLSALNFSRNGSLASYSISEGGSDWRKIIVVNAESKLPLEPALIDVKFSSMAWYGNDGFYYSRYEKPDGSELSAKVDQHLLYYHQIGTPQSEDTLVFGGTDVQKHRYVFASVTDDDRYLVIQGAQSTSGNTLFIRDLTDPDSEIITVQGHDQADTSVLYNEGSTLLLFTNLDAPNGRVVAVNASNPSEANWQELVSETENVLTPSTGGGYLFAHYMVDAVSRIHQFKTDGTKVREIVLPGPGTATSISGKRQAKALYYSFTNYKTPGTIYRLDPDVGESHVHRASAAKFDSRRYVSEQVFYTSSDGTRVPMIITHRKDLIKNGSNPLMLYGYGGFNVSLTPAFSITNALWMEMGGVFAVPNLRGGGEYGKDWHIAGTKLNKQNVFNDFIAAAEYVIDQGYTSSSHLALRGGSNGGLLVGAVMTQRPELAKVALPAVGVMDMLRYHTFTAGAGWAYDYGTSADSPEMFEYLKNYSPVHNIREGVSYPATLVTTADHDDRVVPAHSFKFAAELQSKHKGRNPSLIRIETNAGHGLGTPVSKTIEQYADVFSFTLFNMGIDQLPSTETIE
ncbi:MAG: prolyl oligopeptidase [Candidatus Azotimanducaceae bacterium]|jgi:prolyl oligopeptidase